jgi:hypothetical protein
MTAPAVANAMANSENTAAPRAMTFAHKSGASYIVPLTGRGRSDFFVYISRMVVSVCQPVPDDFVRFPYPEKIFGEIALPEG